MLKGNKMLLIYNIVLLT